MQYFDHNATTPLAPEARAALLAGYDELWFNPSSPYRAAAAAHARLEDARERLAAHFATAPARVVFASGATEASNGIFRWGRRIYGDRFVVAVAATEHPSVLEPAREHAARCVEVAVDRDGRVDPAALEEVLRTERPKLVSVMAANNETGVQQPWRRVADLCRNAGALYHCDASQWVGKRPLAGLAACDFVTACAHKFGGPRGCGFLLLPPSAEGFRIQSGGPQEAGLRGGTEDLPSVLAMLAALEAALDRRPGSAGRDAFEAGLLRRIAGLEVLGKRAERLWNTSALIMPEGDRMRWIAGLERRGFLVSSGAACATGKEGPSHVLAAMGHDAGAAARALRISSGPATRDSDWRALEEAFVEVHAGIAAGGGPGEVVSI